MKTNDAVEAAKWEAWENSNTRENLRNGEYRTTEYDACFDEGFDAGLRHAGEQVETCIWNEDDPESLPQYWTNCGHSFEFDNGDIHDNKFKFCPYCGKAIEEKKFVPKEDE